MLDDQIYLIIQKKIELLMSKLHKFTIYKKKIMYAKNWHISDFDYYALNLQCLSHDKILLAEG